MRVPRTTPGGNRRHDKGATHHEHDNDSDYSSAGPRIRRGWILLEEEQAVTRRGEILPTMQAPSARPLAPVRLL